MRHAVLVIALAAFVTAANSQSDSYRITILPHAGFENPSTKISYNNLPYFSPVNQLRPQIGLRAEYKFKNGLEPFIGLSTSQSMINYNFNDPENGMTAYNASVAKTQLQLQGGLQYTTRPIYLKRQSSATSSGTTIEKTSSCQSFYSNCSRYSSNCCQKKSSDQKAKPQRQSWSVRIQPSAGLGFMPSNGADIVQESVGGQPVYTYNAGSFKTALLTGIGFEFAKSKSRFFTVSVNYFKGLGPNETALTTQSATKTTTTTLNSKVSGWNASIGVPISLSKKQSLTRNTTKEHKTNYDCQRYRMEHHYRCGKVI